VFDDLLPNVPGAPANNKGRAPTGRSLRVEITITSPGSYSLDRPFDFERLGDVGTAC
jgi:hypothetical protein